MLKGAWSIVQFFIDIIIVVVATPVLVLLGRPSEMRNAMADDGVVLDHGEDDPGVDVDE